MTYATYKIDEQLFNELSAKKLELLNLLERVRRDIDNINARLNAVGQLVKIENVDEDVIKGTADGKAAQVSTRSGNKFYCDLQNLSNAIKFNHDIFKFISPEEIYSKLRDKQLVNDLLRQNQAKRYNDFCKASEVVRYNINDVK